MLDAAERHEQEEKERRREEMQQQQGGGGRSRNSRSGNAGGSDIDKEETVRYVNREVNPDHNAHDSN